MGRWLEAEALAPRRFEAEALPPRRSEAEALTPRGSAKRAGGGIDAAGSGAVSRFICYIHVRV